MKQTIPHRVVLGAKRRQFGLSLIELMVAITIGMLVVAALLALYLNITRTNTEMARTNRLIENGRFAMQLLQNDIVHAGFWGEYVPPYDDLTVIAANPPGLPTGIPDPCTALGSWNAAYQNNLVGIPVQGYDANPPTGCVTNFGTDRAANTDTLVVRHAETCLPGVGNCEADDPDKVYFQTALCALQGSAYRVATGEAIDLGGANTLYKRDCIGTGTPPALPITGGTPADKRKVISNIYYVRNLPGTAGDGVPIPTLMRSSFDVDQHAAGQPLIEGIEAFRVEYLIDNANACGAANYALSNSPRLNPASCAVDAVAANNTLPSNRGDGVPDAVCYAETCSANDLMNVVAVRLHVLARNLEPTPGFVDSKVYTLGDLIIDSNALSAAERRYKRHVFSTTVRLHNISGRRETP
ncbi:MAG: PilW family protein [Caldilinea sp.]